MPEPGEPRWFEFDEFRLDTRVRVLWREARVVPLPPKALDTLMSLLRHAGDVVLKQELIAEVWPDTAVDETGLAHNIWVLRKTLGPSGRAIKTVSKRGYRFAGRVRPLAETAAPPGDAAIHAPSTVAHGATREAIPVALAWCDSCERHVWTATMNEALEATGTSAAMLDRYVGCGAVHVLNAAVGRLNLCMPSYIQALAADTNY